MKNTFMLIINYLKIHKTHICFTIFIMGFLIAAGYLETFAIIKALISFIIAMVAFVVGTLWKSEGEDK